MINTICKGSSCNNHNKEEDCAILMVASCIATLTQGFDYCQGTTIQLNVSNENRLLRSGSSLEQRLARFQEQIDTMACCAAVITKIPCSYPLTTKFTERHASLTQRTVFTHNVTTVSVSCVPKLLVALTL